MHVENVEHKLTRNSFQLPENGKVIYYY